MNIHDYSEQQIAELLQQVPRLTAALRHLLMPTSSADLNQAKAELATVFEALDSWCWHTPPCEPGMVCRTGEPRQDDPGPGGAA